MPQRQLADFQSIVESPRSSDIIISELADLLFQIMQVKDPYQSAELATFRSYAARAMRRLNRNIVSHTEAEKIIGALQAYFEFTEHLKTAARMREIANNPDPFPAYRGGENK